MTQHRDPGNCSFCFLPRATNSRFSSSVSSPLCLPSARAQGKWLPTKFWHWPFQRHLQLSFPGGQKPCCFSQLDVILVSFLLWCYRLGSPAWGLEPTFLRGNPPGCWNIPSCHLWEPSHASALPSSHIVVKWFLLSVLGYKVSAQLVIQDDFSTI